MDRVLIRQLEVLRSYLLFAVPVVSRAYLNTVGRCTFIKAAAEAAAAKAAAAVPWKAEGRERKMLTTLL